jgi:hypothetical protein
MYTLDSFNLASGQARNGMVWAELAVRDMGSPPKINNKRKKQHLHDPWLVLESNECGHCFSCLHHKRYQALPELFQWKEKRDGFYLWT